MKYKLLISFLAFFLLFFLHPLMSQEKSKIKFGDVKPEDFATKVYPIDSNAAAVVIADIGSSSMEGNTKGWFSVAHKHFKRVHILNKNGYELANVSIEVYDDGNSEEKLDKLKAVTYNLEDGKVVETKLDVKEGVFKDKINKYWSLKKFTFPNVKEGSIIEFEYTVISDEIDNLKPWSFQGNYPRLGSEYNLSLPTFFSYLFLTQGYLNYDIKETKDRTGHFSVIIPGGVNSSDNVRFSSNVTDYRWVVKNVPALKDEGYTSTIDNHIQKIEFQLSELRDPMPYKRYIESWPQMMGKMLESEGFGYQLDRDNGWLKDINEPLMAAGGTQLERAKRIFAYVRDNFTCISRSALYLSQSLKNLVKSRNGTVADMNLLLTALLKHAKITADPVILATRSNGVTYELYPLMQQYNYVVVKAELDGNSYFLDASEPGLGFGYLPLRCFNGHARVVNKEATALELFSDMITEQKTSSVFVVNDEKGNMIGSMQQKPGYYESLELRRRIREKGQEELLKDIKKAFGSTIEISNPRFDSLSKYDFDIGIQYDFDIKDEKEDIIYLNPMFGEGYKDNPFKSAQRRYPVEMPYAMDETYSLHLEVPPGYELDELPKPVVVKLNEEGDGIFEYRISSSGGNISLRSRVIFKRTTFAPDEYEMLREFFGLIVNKHGEQVVFKKKK